MRSLQQFWSVRRIGEDRVTLARLGRLRLWLARADREFGYAWSHGEETDLMDFAQVPEDVVPDELKWVSILFRNAPRDYLFEAVAPPLPLTVRTMRPISLPAGESSSFYLVVPLFIGIRVMDDGHSWPIGNIPTEKFRRSWFGSTVKGHFTYANPAKLLLDTGQIKTDPNKIVYPLEIRNGSGKMLTFDKLCLNLRHTGLYSGVVHLWGSPVNIEYSGPSKECTVSVSDSVPGMEKDLMEVAAPRKSETRDMAKSVISSCHSF